MQKREPNKTGGILYHYYRKRNASFLVNIYRAGMNASEKDIHKARVDLKKMFALLAFLDTVGPRLFNTGDITQLLIPLFKRSGKLREIQMNLLFIRKPGIGGPELEPFSRYLEAKAARETGKFIRTLVGFDAAKLEKFGGSVRKGCRKISAEKITRKCDLFFQDRSARIRKWLSEPGDIRNIHLIRKEMKRILAVADLLRQLRVDDFMPKLIVALERAEEAIGDWHDRIVLAGAADAFIAAGNPPEAIMPHLAVLKEQALSEAGVILARALPQVNRVVLRIAHIPFQRAA